MPGVTLTDFRKKEQQAPTTTTTVAGDQIEVVQAQIKELRNQIKHLVRSNAELEEALADEYDKDFAEAIEENKGVIIKREIQIKELQDLLPKHVAEPVEVEADDGLYI
jgi:predicted  nucleic acid-binding Zn-ribbon protein